MILDGALLVYDITDLESFNKVKTWVKELRKIVGNDIVIAIAGNKIDLEKNRHVVEREAREYADSVGASHFHTSAKSNKGLDDVFNDITQSESMYRTVTANRIVLTYFLSCVLIFLELLEKKGGRAVATQGSKAKLVIIDDAPGGSGSGSSGGGCC